MPGPDQRPVPVNPETEAGLAPADTSRKVLFGLLFVVFISAPLLFLPLWIGFSVAPAFGGLLWVLYRATSTRAPVTRPARTAGAVTCPECGSQQTDEVDALDPGGALVHEWRCFQCEHRWR